MPEQKIEFETERQLHQLYGESPANLNEVERMLSVRLVARGNCLTIEGEQENVDRCGELFSLLLKGREQGFVSGKSDFGRFLAKVSSGKTKELQDLLENPLVLKIRKKSVVPRNLGQRRFLDLILKNDLVFGIGPAGTGKTFLAECMAGEAGVPTVALKNFRERWVGTSEGNLEKVFRILRALGRCMVFVDEADQALGRRVSEGDGGLSGRLYSMIAKEMGKNENRGRIVWILASSRPDLIEVDLKRPGRVDVKIPILPTSTTAESMDLIRALLKRNDMVLSDEEAQSLVEKAPLLMTAGAAEALAAKVMRLEVTSERRTIEVLAEMLEDYQPSVSMEVIEFQIDLAVREATDIELVPEYFQNRRNTKPHTEIES